MEKIVDLVESLYMEKSYRFEEEIINLKCENEKLKNKVENFIINEFDVYDLKNLNEFDVYDYHCKSMIKKMIKYEISDLKEWERIILKAKDMYEKENSNDQ